MRWIKKLLRIIAIVLPSFTIITLSPPSHALKYNYESLYLPSHDIYTNGTGIGTNVGYNISQPLQNSLASYNPPTQVIQRIGTPCYNSTISTPSVRETSTMRTWILDNFRINILNSGNYPTDTLWCHDRSKTEWYEWSSIQLERNKESADSSNGGLSSLFHKTTPFNPPQKYWYSFTIPMTTGDNLPPYTPDHSFVFKGTFLGEFYNSDKNGALSPASGNKDIRMTISGASSDGTQLVNRVLISDDPSANSCSPLVFGASRNSYSFTCTFTPDREILYPTISLSVAPRGCYTSSQCDMTVPVFYSEIGDVFFHDFHVITDGDDTPSDLPANPSFTGNNIEGSPLYNETQGQSYSASLINLFDFSLLNPFIGIFGLFNNGGQCVQIPIIAGMLGAENTEYCSWFSNDTRSILTPVLGISSTMLLFGFLVRWLSSTSGNMFVDNDIDNTGMGFGLKNKGGN